MRFELTHVVSVLLTKVVNSSTTNTASVDAFHHENRVGAAVPDPGDLEPGVITKELGGVELAEEGCFANVIAFFFELLFQNLSSISL